MITGNRHFAFLANPGSLCTGKANHPGSFPGGDYTPSFGQTPAVPLAERIYLLARRSLFPACGVAPESKQSVCRYNNRMKTGYVI
jgi:hypothetical protein